MFIPVWALIAVGVLVLVVLLWAIQAASGRNPLPFPDPGSRIFAAATPEALNAIVGLLGEYGIRQRFRVNTASVGRAIMWDGTIINYSDPEVLRKLKMASACIGLVADNPAKAAEKAAAYLRSQGFSADVVLDAEPDLNIAFVLTNAMNGTALNFRRHVIHMPRPGK